MINCVPVIAILSGDLQLRGNERLTFGLMLRIHKSRREMANSLRVLVVEDDQPIRSLLEEALVEGGFEASIAASGEEALFLLREGKYDLLALDIKLGRDGIGGWHIARRARALNPSLPVIYITGAAAEEWKVHGVANSIILAKPFAPSQLINAISEILTTSCATEEKRPAAS